MSDGTAAREPSMEDILASIRRIIDEEDTRDGRPSSDGAAYEDGDGSVDPRLPMMAAAAPARGEDAPAEAEAEADAAEEGEAIFPERESLFWSRATGRGGADAADAPAEASDDAPTDEDGDGEPDDGEDAAGRSNALGMAAALAGGGAAAAAATSGAATDIFSRAQSKLGGTGGARLTARERMQSLAARSTERVEETSGSLDSLSDLPDLDSLDDVAEDALPDFSGVEEELADAEIFELTDTVNDFGGAASDAVSDLSDTAEGAATEAADAASDAGDEARGSAEALIARAGADMPDAADFGFGSAAEGETSSDYENAFDMAEGEAASRLAVVTGSEEERAGEADASEASEAEETAEAATDPYEDVFDLTTPLDAESAEPEAEAEATEDGDIEAAIAESLAVEPGETLEEVAAEAVAGSEDEVEPLEAMASFDAAEAPDTDTDTDADDAERAGTLTNGEDYAVGAADTTSNADGEDAAATDESDEDARDDGADAGFGAAAMAGLAGAGAAYGFAGGDRAETEVAREGDASRDASRDTFGAGEDRVEADHAQADEPVSFEADDPAMTDRRDPAEDMPEEEPLGFSDTFSASDVYHDEPPALDDDYSASLDAPEEEPVRHRAAFAERPAQDDGMERVGGLVRDAMERDPVDYADPSALVSMTSEELSARALASLADVEGEAQRRMYGAMRIGEDSGSESIEGMVKSMLKPMLREWLDDNLPDMVETMVRGEVERISAKSRKYSRAARED